MQRSALAAILDSHEPSEHLWQMGQWVNRRLVPKGCRLGGMLIEEREDSESVLIPPPLESSPCKLPEHKAQELGFSVTLLIRGSLQAQGCSQAMSLLEQGIFPFLGTGFSEDCSKFHW